MVQKKFPGHAIIEPLRWVREQRFQLREASVADAACAEEMVREGVFYDLRTTSTEPVSTWVVELDHQVVAIASSRAAHAEIGWASEPLGELRAVRESAGVENATIGCGLCLHEKLDRAQRHFVQRLTRTLLAQEAGHRWCVVWVPLPGASPYSCAERVQQIVHGGLRWEPLEVVLADGYWPIGVDSQREAVVCALRNAAF